MASAELEPILLREGIVLAAPQLIGRLNVVADAAGSAARMQALDSVLAAAGDAAQRLIRVLASEETPLPRRLALELTARLALTRTDSSEMVLTTWLRPLLRDRRIPARVRVAAVVKLVQSSKATDASRLLRDFTFGYGPGRLLERRASLRKRFIGRERVFDRFADRLAARLPLRCPRCRLRLAPEPMARHLWDRHRRLLVGRRVRAPWRLIEQWTITLGAVAAQRRLLRSGGLNGDSIAFLRRHLAGPDAGLCPQCFAARSLEPANFPAPADIPPLTLSHGRLSGQGFLVELSPTLAGPRLRIEGPNGVLFDGPEAAPPGFPRNRFATVPFVVLAFLLTVLAPASWCLPATLAVLLFAGWIAVASRRNEPDDRPDRVVDHAWRFFAPQVTSNSSFFLAGLAATSVRHGNPMLRDKALRRLATTLRATVRTHSTLPSHLIAIQRLRGADAAAIGGDPVVILADAVRFCFTGELTPAAADLLLDPDLLAGWSRGWIARLRVLLAARAFEAGLGVWNLHALGRALPQLGRVLKVDDTDGLARLRCLWDQRSARPWRRCGPAATVFELAKYPMLGGQHLETAPDLLLFQPLPAGGEPVHLLACGRGLIVGGGLIHEWPTKIESKPLPGSRGGGYELRFGPNAIQVHGDVDALLRKLVEWGDYFFKEFLPWIGNALTRPDEGASDRLGPLTVHCLECRTAFIGRRGEVGYRLTETSSPAATDSA